MRLAVPGIPRIAMSAAVTLALSFLVLASCGRKDPGPGGVKVLLTLPRDMVETVSSIDVLFDQPMVAVGATTAPVVEPPFTIRPRVPGRYRWIGTRTASFVPDQRLPAATRFEGRIPAGTRSVNGHSVATDVAWTFETPRPAVTRALPEDGDRHVAPDLRIVLEFNQPIEPAEVRRSARLVSAAGKSVSLDARRLLEADQAMIPYWEAGPIEERVLLTPRARLDPDTEWRLELAAGLRASEGSLPMTGAWTRTFRTYGPFRAESLTVQPSQTDAVQLHLTNPVDADSLLPRLAFDPPVTLHGAWQEWGTDRVTIHGSFRAGRSYRLSISPGVVDAFGQPLPPGPLGPVTIPDAAPALMIHPRDAVLERRDRREVAILLTNVERARLEMKALSSEEVGRMASGRGTLGLRISGDRPGEHVATLTRRSAWNDPDTFFVATDQVLGTGKGGVVLVRVQSLDPQREAPGSPDPDGRPRFLPQPQSRTMVRVTDLGLTAKTSEANHLFWLTGLADGGPIAGAEVEVLTARGRLVWRGTTDADGLARGPGLAPATGEDWPLYAVARTGEDMTWLTLGGDWSLEPWNYGITAGSWNIERDCDGMIYGDRDLYRPGERVHLKAILRRRSLTGLVNPGALAVRLEIDDPRGNEIVRREVALSSHGTTDLDLSLPPAATPGTWSVRVVPPGPPQDRRWSVAGSFLVAEYRAPDFKVELKSRREAYLPGQPFEVDVAADYFFGASLAGGAVRWTLTRQPFHFAPKGYEEFTFRDDDVTPNYEWLASRGEAQLDDRGRFTLAPIVDLGSIPVSLEHRLEVQVQDGTGRSSAAEIARPVHRGQAYPGVKLGSDLVRAGQKIGADVVLVAPDGRPARNVTGRISLHRREWLSVRRLMVGGIIGSETTEHDTLLSRRPLPAGPGPHHVDFEIPTAGYYRVVVEATDSGGNRQTSAAGLYASGPGEFAWGWEPGVKLDLVADRKSWRPGETARILVRAPFTGALALFTVEREGVLSSWTRRLEGTSEVVEVPIPATGAAPNLYFSAALILGSGARRGADPRIQKPEFRLGLLNLPVDHDDRRLAVAIRPDRVRAAPRDSITIHLALTDPAGLGVPGEVSVAVVDEAVLRLLGTKTPDPLSWFYRPRPLSVTTSELRRQVRRALAEGKAKGGDAGGGGGEAMSYRSAFATTALWKGSLMTDASGKARLGFRLPDNLTTFRVMVVALDQGQRFGHGDTTLVVTKPLLIQPALPRFATTGDRFRGGAIVHNRTEAPMTIRVALSADGLTVTGPAERSGMNVPPGGSQRVDFELSAGAATSARVRLAATAPGASDGMEITIPVYDPVIERFDATSGQIVSRTDEVIFVPASARPESAAVHVTLSPTLLGGLEPAFTYLASYPYGCLEQVSSRQWGRMLAARLLDTEPSAPIGRETIEILSRYQRDDGSFGLWPGRGEGQVALTAWALGTMAEARRAGADAEALARPALRYLGWYLQTGSGDTAAVISRASDQAMALRAMSEWELEPWAAAIHRQALEFLTSSRRQLSATTRLSLALSWSSLGGAAPMADLILKELENQVEMVAGTAWLEERGFVHGLECWEVWWDSPARRNALYLTALLSRPVRSPVEPLLTRRLLTERRNGHWLNTQGNILSLVALAAYREVYERDTPNLTATLALGTAPRPPARFTGRQDKPEERTWPAPPPGSSAPLSIERSGRGSLYYAANVSYRESSVGRPAVESALTITRRWELFDPAAGRERTVPLRSGDLVLVRLTLVVPEALDYLVVADPPPAGLEPVQLEFATTGSTTGRRLVERSERKRSDAGSTTAHPSFTEMRDREVRAFFDHIGPGVHEYRYLARAVTPGRFGAPRARAELMYHPEVAAFTDGPIVEIGPR